MKLTAHFKLPKRYKMGEAILLFPICVFMASCTQTIWPFFYTVLTCCTFRRQWLLSFICLTVDTLTVHTKVLMWQNITQTVISIKKLHHRTTKNDTNTLNIHIVRPCAVQYCILWYVGTSSGQECTAATVLHNVVRGYWQWAGMYCSKGTA